MTSDLDLLEKFTRENSQDAFGEIVRRHLNLVYSAALRQVRSPQLAEEIAQSVFTDLARHAGKMGSAGVPPAHLLTPWLYAVTRRTAIDAIRKESRRQLREQIATEMNHMNATESSAGVSPTWSEIEKVLDEAMESLDEPDRSAVLLRFFENKCLREVGEALGASEDAAQKRVSRAVERLREFFSKRKVIVGASGLAVLISANAVQAAPIGLAAAISTVVLAGTAVSASTAITATKVIAMTALQKTIIGTALVAAVGTGIFEAHQATQLRLQVHTLQQQQAPLVEKLQQLQQERDEVNGRLAAMQMENDQLKSNQNEAELLRLRAEVTRLENAEAQRQNDPMAVAANAWLNRVKQLKQYIEEHPNEKVPEFQYLTEREWLTVADAGLSTDNFKTTNEYRNAMQMLRFQAEQRFAISVEQALMDYSKANNGGFPSDLSQLQPFCGAAAENTLTELYEIAPVSIVKNTSGATQNGVSMYIDSRAKGDWIVTRKVRMNPSSTSRLAIFAGGETYWQSPLNGTP